MAVFSVTPPFLGAVSIAFGMATLASFATLQNGRYSPKLAAPNVRLGGVESLSLPLFDLGMVVEPGLGFSGFLCKEGLVVIRSLLYYAPEKIGIGLRLVRRPGRWAYGQHGWS